MSDTSSALNVIQQLSADAALLHRFCHGGDAESVVLGGKATPTVHSFLSSWIEFLHSVTHAGESFAPGLESGYYDTASGTEYAASAWLRTSNYCPVTAGRVYAVDFKDLASASGALVNRVDVHIYDDSKTWISCIPDTPFFKAPSSAKYVRLNFRFAADVSAGSSPSVSVTDVVAGTRSAVGGNGGRAIAADWKRGFVPYENPTGAFLSNVGGSADSRYALVFVSKGDLVWLKADQSAAQSIIACIDSSGEIVNKVANDGEARSFWKDAMWVADQDTCVILSANLALKSNPECIIYPNFLYNDYEFNDALTNKAGNIKKDTGFCSSQEEEYDPTSSAAVYASSQLICLKKGQHISFVTSGSSNTYVFAVYDEANVVVNDESFSPSVQSMQFYGYRCEDDFCFIRICGRLLEEEYGAEKMLYYRVYNKGETSGKKFAMLGDSYVNNDNRSSYAHAAYNLGMIFTPYGVSGNTVSSYQENGMCIRYTEMGDDFDYIGVVGGRNDYNNSVPIGSLDSTDTSTFCGALNVLCEGLIKKYIGKKLFGVTSWNVNETQNEYNEAFIAVVSGRWGIPVLDAYKMAGVYVKVSEFRQAYCVTPTDVSHLNYLGHMKVMAPVVESFLKTL